MSDVTISAGFMTELATVFTAVEGNIIAFIPCVGKPKESLSPLAKWKLNAICAFTSAIYTESSITGKWPWGEDLLAVATFLQIYCILKYFCVLKWYMRLYFHIYMNHINGSLHLYVN